MKIRQRSSRECLTTVYCVVGSDPDNPARECVYIGEGDNVLTRLAQAGP